LRKTEKNVTLAAKSPDDRPHAFAKPVKY